MRGLVEFFLRNSIAGNILVICMLFFGYRGLQSMKSTMFPSAAERFIKVQIAYPGASPQEMEEGIVLKIEENLQGRTGIERVTSTSSENTAVVDVEIKKGYDIDVILQDVKNAVSQITSFPVGMESPQVFKVENRSFAFSFSLSGDVPLKTLKQFARRCEEEIRAAKQASKITLTGFPNEEIEIAFRENDLIRYQITFAEATLAVRNANLEITGGRVKGQQEELLLRARNKGYFADDLQNIPIKTTADGSIIYLYQLADLRDKWEDVPTRSYMNGKPSVVVSIDNTDDEDVLVMTDYLNEYVKNFNEKNTQVKATVIRDGSITLRQRIDLLVENGIMGFFLVLGALSLFLHWRIAFWVASSIPVAFAGLFMIGALTGVTVNAISLFGMIVVVGILVDDGIVISENIYAYYEKGLTKFEAALQGTLDVLPSVVSSVLTTVVAFSAFFFLDGRIGDIFFDLAIVVVITLLVSLLEGIFVLPSHLYHSKALSKDANNNAFMRFMDKVFTVLRDKLYAPILRFALNGANKFIVLAVLVSALLLSFGAVMGGHVKITFFPFIERDDIEFSIQMPAGTREQYTMQWLDHVEKKAWEINELFKARRTDGKDVVEKVEKNIGAATYQGKLKITLLNGEERQVPILEISDSLRNAAGEIVGAETVSYGVASPFGKAVSVSVLGTDLKELTAAVEMMKTELRAIKGLKDVNDNNQAGLREVNIELTDKARQLGLNLQEVIAQVRQGFFGSEVQRIQRGRDEVRVWVRYAESERKTLGQLENMRIRFADGREFPLHEIASFTERRGVSAINHISGEREIKVEGDLATKNESVLDITNQIRNEIAPRIKQHYPNVKFLIEGQNKENEKTMKSMSIVLPIVGIAMVLIILLTFRSISQTLAVVSLIPFGFIGVVLGHWLLGSPISFFSFLGVVALIGVMVNDSLVMVEAMNGLLQEGKPFRQAVYEAGLSRFRAILLTSVTTLLGLGPLIFETSIQGQFLIPMAISIAFGLAVATVLSLIVLPIILTLINSYKTWVASAWLQHTVAPEEVEPALRDEHTSSGVNLFWQWIFLPVSLYIIYTVIKTFLS